VKQITHLHLEPRLRKAPILASSPYTTSWSGYSHSFFNFTEKHYSSDYIYDEGTPRRVSDVLATWPNYQSAFYTPICSVSLLTIRCFVLNVTNASFPARSVSDMTTGVGSDETIGGPYRRG